MFKLIKKDSNAKLPSKGSIDSAGYDFFPLTSGTIKSGQQDTIETGLKVAYIPEGYYLQLFSRSGLAIKQNILTMGGVIDRDYRGEIKVILKNLGNKDFDYSPDNAITQGVFVAYGCFQVEEVLTADESSRGENGFGSTDVKKINDDIDKGIKEANNDINNNNEIKNNDNNISIGTHSLMKSQIYHKYGNDKDLNTVFNNDEVIKKNMQLQTELNALYEIYYYVNGSYNHSLRKESAWYPPHMKHNDMLSMLKLMKIDNYVDENRLTTYSEKDYNRYINIVFVKNIKYIYDNASIADLELCESINMYYAKCSKDGKAVVEENTSNNDINVTSNNTSNNTPNNTPNDVNNNIENDDKTKIKSNIIDPTLYQYS